MFIQLNWKPDKTAEKPLYLQIKDYIQTKIENGEWTVGTKIPSQRKLAEIFEVNRSTIVLAFDELMADGLLEGKSGKGTMVKNNLWSLFSSTPPTDWSSMVKRGSHQPNLPTIQDIHKVEPLPNIIRLGTGLALMKAEKIPLHFYRYLYREVGGGWLWVERLELPDAALAERIHRPGIEIFVLYANGAPAGYYELDFADSKSTRLVYFGLMADWTGMRIGPWFLATAISEALSRGAEEIQVNTCTLDHPAALPLYQRLGFRPIRRENRRLIVPQGVPIPVHIVAQIGP